ncbi:MAG: hypothetical protein ACP5UA_05085 [Candidatus Hydrogenedens sp.]
MDGDNIRMYDGIYIACGWGIKELFRGGESESEAVGLLPEETRKMSPLGENCKIVEVNRTKRKKR